MLDIFIDADACPVRPETLKVAERYTLTVFVVSCGNVRVPIDPLIRPVLVEAGFDAADDWIAQHIARSDICITNDVPLASRCLKQGATALRPTGQLFTLQNIGDALAGRELAAHLRELGVAPGGPRPMTPKDRSRFLQALDTLIQQLKHEKVSGPL